MPLLDTRGSRRRQVSTATGLNLHLSHSHRLYREMMANRRAAVMLWSDNCTVQHDLSVPLSLTHILSQSERSASLDRKGALPDCSDSKAAA